VLRPPLARLSDQIEIDVAAPVQAAKLSIRWLSRRVAPIYWQRTGR
jgi:hypothetical protein